MEAVFSWVAFYEGLAHRLLAWRDRQKELIALFNTLRESGEPVMPMSDLNAAGNRIPLEEIDPFTVFALFNRGMTDANRRSLATAFGKSLEVAAAPPSVFAGIPVVNNQRTWFFHYAQNRKATDIPTLWSLFQSALKDDPLESQEFANAFDAALTTKGVRFSLTIGLFWVQPTTFASLDKIVRAYTNLAIKPGDLSAAKYIDLVTQLRTRYESFPKLSYDAWLASKDPGPTGGDPVGESETEEIESPQAPVFWFVGANWDGEDQTSRFISKGIWENDYSDKLLDKVRSMRAGERIAIKSSYIRKNDLPFQAPGRFVSVMAIKAVGTIIANPEDGQRVEVQWQKTLVPPREWHFTRIDRQSGEYVGAGSPTTIF